MRFRAYCILLFKILFSPTQKAIVVGFSLFFASFGLAAQNHPDSVQNQVLPSVNVTALRSSLKNLETPAHIVSTKRTEIAAKFARTLPEFFDHQNTFYLQKTNHGGGSVFLRGLTGNQTLTLIDGIRLNNSTFRYGPNQYLNTINPFMVETLEVMPGGGAVAYGSDAIGGLIQIFTRNPNFEKKIDAQLQSRLTSQNMEKTVNGMLSWSTEKLALMAAGSFRDFGHLVGGRGIGVQDPSGYKEMAYDLKAIWKVARNTKLTMASQNLNQHHVPVYHKVLLENFLLNEMSLQSRKLSYIKMEHTNKNRLLRSQNVSVSYQDNAEQRTSQKLGVATTKLEDDKVKTLGFTLSNHSAINPYWSFNTGFEIYKDQVGSKASSFDGTQSLAFKGLYPDQAKYSNQSWFTLHHLNLGNFHLNAGGRFNTIRLNIPDENLGTSQLKYQAFVYNLGLLYKMGENAAIYTSWGTSFRAPNIDDLGTLGIVDFRYEIPAADLEPEKAQQIELGWKYTSKIHQIQFSVFNNQLKDLITREKLDGQLIEDYQVYAKKNTGRANIYGVEASLKSTISRYIILQTGLCYTYGQDLSKNEPLRRIPPLFGNVGLKWFKGNTYLQANALWAAAQNRLASGDIADNRIGPNGTPGYTIFNLQAGYTLKKLTFEIQLNNLGNVAYKTHGSGIYQSGRSATLNINWQL